MAAITHTEPTEATRNAQRATWLGVVGLLTLLSVGRLLVTAFGYGIPAWFDEELNPLINLILGNQPITSIDARQYGVVVFLVFDAPLRAVRLFGACSSEAPCGLSANLVGLAAYAGIIALPCVVAALLLMGKRYADRDPSHWLVLTLAWSSAVPLLYVIAQHMVDSWQLLFVSASLFLFTGSARQRRFAGVPLGIATLTKLLPGLLLLYMAVRAWRVAALGLVAIGVLLLVGQVLYGWLMGFGYPLAMLSMGGETIARWSTHFENNSVRGLLFKIADGYRLQGDTTNYALDPRLFPYLNVLAYAIAASLVGYLVLAAWRGRHDESVPRRSVEFGLALVTMLLVSPHTAQDYLVTVLPVLAIWLYLWARHLPRSWSIGQTTLGVAAALLIGVFVPMNFAARALPIGWLLGVTGNAHNTLFADQIGSAIGAYDFFGLPGVGLILAWLLLFRLERQSAPAQVLAHVPAHGVSEPSASAAA